MPALPPSSLSPAERISSTSIDRSDHAALPVVGVLTWSVIRAALGGHQRSDLGARGEAKLGQRVLDMRFRGAL